MNIDLRDVTGFRGEKIVELALTDHTQFDKPLFRPGFLGDKWPTVDFYVELTDVRGKRPYFFVQAKATSSRLTNQSRDLRVLTKKADVQKLLMIPGPTYVIGVHEPSMRAFIRSVHLGMPKRPITRIPLEHELTSITLRTLHNEVRDFWESTNHKPTTSQFQ